MQENKVSLEEINSLFLRGLKFCNSCKTIKKIEDFYKDKSNRYGIESRCKECSKKHSSIQREINPEKVREIRRNTRNKRAEYYRKQKKEWAENNKDHIKEYKRDKYNNDPIYKMQIACRQLVKRMFKSTGVKKCYKTQEVLGYTPNDLKIHIEKQFKEGMNWDNYGEWHIDHIVPISFAKNLSEGIWLSRLENLQPLWAKDNILKSNNII